METPRLGRQGFEVTAHQCEVGSQAVEVLLQESRALVGEVVIRSDQRPSNLYVKDMSCFVNIPHCAVDTSRSLGDQATLAEVTFGQMSRGYV